MKKLAYLLFAFAFCCFIFSCEQDDVSPSGNSGPVNTDVYVGIWKNKSSCDSCSSNTWQCGQTYTKLAINEDYTFQEIGVYSGNIFRSGTYSESNGSITFDDGTEILVHSYNMVNDSLVEFFYPDTQCPSGGYIMDTYTKE